MHTPMKFYLHLLVCGLTVGQRAGPVCMHVILLILCAQKELRRVRF